MIIITAERKKKALERVLFSFKNMKKITIPSHGGGETHEGGATNSEGDYTAMDFLEDVSFAGMEITKFVTFFVTTTMGFVNGTGYKDIAEGFITYMDNAGTSELIHIRCWRNHCRINQPDFSKCRHGKI